MEIKNIKSRHYQILNFYGEEIKIYPDDTAEIVSKKCQDVYDRLSCQAKFGCHSIATVII